MKKYDNYDDMFDNFDGFDIDADCPPNPDENKELTASEADAIEARHAQGLADQISGRSPLANHHKKSDELAEIEKDLGLDFTDGVADPTPYFWNEWRTRKSEIKSIGISVEKSNGKWKVYFKRHADAADARVDAFLAGTFK